MTGPVMRRNTLQRQVILEELRRLKSHPTAAELYEAVRRRLPRISLGTVYRNLELLNRLGEIRKLELGTGEARFDGDLRRHSHVRCVECGAVGDVPEPAGAVPYREPAMLGGFRILGHRLEYLGVCPACQAGQAGEDDPRNAD